MLLLLKLHNNVMMRFHATQYYTMIPHNHVSHPKSKSPKNRKTKIPTQNAMFFHLQHPLQPPQPKHPVTPNTQKLHQNTHPTNPRRKSCCTDPGTSWYARVPTVQASSCSVVVKEPPPNTFFSSTPRERCVSRWMGGCAEGCEQLGMG